MVNGQISPRKSKIGTAPNLVERELLHTRIGQPKHQNEWELIRRWHMFLIVADQPQHAVIRSGVVQGKDQR
jgi:hypothetical protein